MPVYHNPQQIPLPKGWPGRVKSAVLHVISLARFAVTCARARAANSRSAAARLGARNDQQDQEIALLREELRIKDARMERIPPQKRPHYRQVDRMAILELRAARGWSAQQTATALQVTPPTVASWGSRVDEEGPDALVQVPQPVNRFLQFVRYIVQRLKTLCPAMGKLKIAQVLCRAGLHLGTTTVGSMLKQPPAPEPANLAAHNISQRVVTAKHPNHVWHVDLTVTPTSVGFWAPWLPFAFPQCWSCLPSADPIRPSRFV